MVLKHNTRSPQLTQTINETSGFAGIFFFFIEHRCFPIFFNHKLFNFKIKGRLKR